MRHVRCGLRSAFRVPAHWRGVKRFGAYHYRTSLAISLIIPAFLSCTTLMTPQAGWMMFVQLVGGLAFYSFLLLPTALKFDFRRDVDRLATLKSLPISPLAITVGQLAVPVLLCTLFQVGVLLVAMVVRPYPIWLGLAALVLLVPINVLIFATENLIFLLYPYRLSQEGLGVFLRTILTFTAKSVIFVMALVIVVVWALLVRQIGTWLLPGGELVAISLVFCTGIWSLVMAAAIGTVALLARVYGRFDPSQDAPAVS